MLASRSLSTCLVAFIWIAVAQPSHSKDPEEHEYLYAPEGNRLRVVDLTELRRGLATSTVLIERASLDPENGRDINGMVCARPGTHGGFVAGEDTGQPARPAGWGIFRADGTQVGKLVAGAGSRVPEPHGCAFDREGRLFTSEVGDPGFSASNGQLILWFPPYEGFGPPRYCKLATDIGTAGGIAIDTQGRVYVASSSGREILRFSPPFPTGPDAEHGCGRTDPYGDPLATHVQREPFTGARWKHGLVTYSGLAFGHKGHLYASSVLTGRIAEFSPDGKLVRMLVEPTSWLPPHPTGTPQGLAVDSRGDLYYADLDIVWEAWMPGPSSNGRIWRIRFDETGQPSRPEVVLEGLAYPDGLGIIFRRFQPN
ncbi:hypothetical protein MK489_22765 [Myxococcota bacterium]|nr:hypothetical protein [Myxococcota bacterium]